MQVMVMVMGDSDGVMGEGGDGVMGEGGDGVTVMG